MEILGMGLNTNQLTNLIQNHLGKTTRTAAQATSLVQKDQNQHHAKRAYNWVQKNSNQLNVWACSNNFFFLSQVNESPKIYELV